MEIARAVLGAVLLLFLPGFAWSFVFWGRGQIEWLDRIVLSLAISIGLVPLTIFIAHKLFGMPINATSSIIVVTCLIVLALILIFIKFKKVIRFIYPWQSR